MGQRFVKVDQYWPNIGLFIVFFIYDPDWTDLHGTFIRGVSPTKEQLIHP